MGALLSDVRRRGRRRGTVLATVLLAVVVAATGCGGGSVQSDQTAAPQGAVLHQGPPGPGDDFPLLPSSCQSPAEPMPFRPCHVTDYGSAAPTVAVWGDSHAWMYLPAMRKAADKKHINLVMILAGGCPPARPVPRVAGQAYTACEAHDTKALEWVRSVAARKPPFALIVGSYWTGYRSGFEGGFLDGAPAAGATPSSPSSPGSTSTGTPTAPGDDATNTYVQRVDALAQDRTMPLFETLGHMGIQVDVIGQAATVPPDVAPCAQGRAPYECDVPRDQAMTDESATTAYLHQLMAPLSGRSLLIDPSPVYCDATTCHGMVDGRSTWFDDIHLAKDLTRRMTRYFMPAFSRLS